MPILYAILHHLRNITYAMYQKCVSQVELGPDFVCNEK